MASRLDFFFASVCFASGWPAPPSASALRLPAAAARAGRLGLRSVALVAVLMLAALALTGRRSAASALSTTRRRRHCVAAIRLVETVAPSANTKRERDHDESEAPTRNRIEKTRPIWQAVAALRRAWRARGETERGKCGQCESANTKTTRGIHAGSVGALPTHITTPAGRGLPANKPGRRCPPGHSRPPHPEEWLEPTRNRVEERRRAPSSKCVEFLLTRSSQPSRVSWIPNPLLQTSLPDPYRWPSCGSHT